MRTFYFAFLIIVFLSCNNNSPTEPQNHAPIIQDILLSNPSPKIGSGVFISAVATDADGDSLNYYWTCSAGDFPPWHTSGLSYDVSTNPTRWQAPNTAGDYTVTCTVSDGKEIDNKSKTITVIK